MCVCETGAGRLAVAVSVGIRVASMEWDALAISVRGAAAPGCTGFVPLATTTGGVDPCSANRDAGTRFAFAMAGACVGGAGAAAGRRGFVSARSFRGKIDGVSFVVAGVDVPGVVESDVAGGGRVCVVESDVACAEAACGGVRTPAEPGRLNTATLCCSRSANG